MTASQADPSFLILSNHSRGALERAVKQRPAAMAERMALAIVEGDVDGAVALMDAGVSLSGSARIPGVPHSIGLHGLLMGSFSEKMANAIWPRIVAKCPWTVSHVGILRSMIGAAESNIDPRPARAWLDSVLNQLSPDLFLQTALYGWELIMSSSGGELAQASDMIQRCWSGLDRISDKARAPGDTRILGFYTGMRMLDNDGDASGLLNSDRMKLWLMNALTPNGLRCFTNQRWNRLQTILNQDPGARRLFDQAVQQENWSVELPTRLRKARGRLPESDRSPNLVRIDSLELALLLFSPMRAKMLNTPEVMDRIAKKAMRGDSIDTRLALFSALSSAQCLALINSQAALWRAWRDENGRNVFHYLVAMRAESVALLRGAKKMNAAMLIETGHTEPVVAWMSPGHRVRAEQMALAAVAGEATIGGRRRSM